jgi:hypothetical protein
MASIRAARAGVAEYRQHFLLFGGVRADVTGDEGVARFELGQAGAVMICQG